MTPLHRGSVSIPRAQPISHAVPPHAPRRRHGPSMLHTQFGPSASSQCKRVRCAWHSVSNARRSPRPLDSTV